MASGVLPRRRPRNPPRNGRLVFEIGRPESSLQSRLFKQHEIDLIDDNEHRCPDRDHARAMEQRLTNQHRHDAADHRIPNVPVRADRNEPAGWIPWRERALTDARKERYAPREEPEAAKKNHYARDMAKQCGNRSSRPVSVRHHPRAEQPHRYYHYRDEWKHQDREQMAQNHHGVHPPLTSRDLSKMAVRWIVSGLAAAQAAGVSGGDTLTSWISAAAVAEIQPGAKITSGLTAAGPGRTDRQRSLPCAARTPIVPRGAPRWMSLPLRASPVFHRRSTIP